MYCQQCGSRINWTEDSREHQGPRDLRLDLLRETQTALRRLDAALTVYEHSLHLEAHYKWKTR